MKVDGEVRLKLLPEDDVDRTSCRMEKHHQYNLSTLNLMMNKS